MYLCGDMTTKDDYSCYYANGYDHNLQYNVGVVFQPGPYKWKSYSRIHTEGEPEERYWMCVRAIPF